MLIDICMGTRTSWKIMLVLSESPGKAVSKKEIKELTRLGNKTIDKFLLLLEKFNFIRTKKIGRTKYYNLDMNCQYTKNILEIVKLEKKESNNLDFYVQNVLRDFIYELINLEIEKISKIILFGSYAKKTFTENSDIDLAIIIKEKNPDFELAVTDIIDKIKKRYKRDIQPHYFTIEEFDKKDKLALDIMKDGVELL